METWAMWLERVYVQADAETIIAAELINQMKQDKNPPCTSDPEHLNAKGAKQTGQSIIFWILTFNDSKLEIMLW